MNAVSRQTKRQAERRAVKNGIATFKVQARTEAKRALLERQTRREKAGFYGKPVASFISPKRSRVTQRKVNKGQAFARIIKKKTEFGRDLQFHATKGWRSYSAA